MISYRIMVAGDVASALSLSRLAGWNQTNEDWKLFLDVSPTGCFVAVDDSGNIHGTVATVRYQNHFSWIGMVLVHPAMQRRGIGTALLRRALDILPDEETIKLDATPSGRQIYLPLGFVDEYPISRMELAKVSADLPWPAAGARPVTEVDMPGLAAFDYPLFGADRKVLLDAIRRRSSQFAFVADGTSGVAGYCLGREGERFTHIGPIVANDVDTARRLCSTVLKNLHGRPVVIDALQHSATWIDWLHDIGFREQRALVRMYRGKKYAGTPEKQFAILGPEFG